MSGGTGSGRRSWHYGWDALDRLVSCEFIGANSEKERWVFAYDPFGRRVSKVRQLSGKALDEARLRWPEPQGRADTPAVGTAFLWDGDQLAAEAPLHLGGRIDWARAVKWHFADEGGFTPIAKELPDGALLHIVSDHLATPKEMFDQKGELVWAADHHVWGAVRTVRTHGALALKPSHDPQPAELHCPFRFPGQYEDEETGLYYNRHRHYDPLTGQYASPDPIGLAGGDRPQGYVERPTVWVDPLGLSRAIANPIPENFARVVPGDINPKSLGAPSAADVFVTDAKALEGLTAKEIAKKLTIPESPSGFRIVVFPSKNVSGIATPINRINPGFVGGGKTAGGAPEFVIPNGPLPEGSTSWIVSP